MALLYDASVGYVLAINLVGYTFIGYIASKLRVAFDQKLRKLKHKSDLVMTLICFLLVLVREVLDVGYLFLIGSEQSMVTLLRALFCALYSAVLITPCSFLLRPVMTGHLHVRKKKSDLIEDSDEAGRQP